MPPPEMDSMDRTPYTGPWCTATEPINHQHPAEAYLGPLRTYDEEVNPHQYIGLKESNSESWDSVSPPPLKHSSGLGLTYIKQEAVEPLSPSISKKSFAFNRFERQNSQEGNRALNEHFKHLHHYQLDRRHEPSKERQRKDAHNIIERRRRGKINDQIHELYALLPQHEDEDFYQDIGSFRLNKGTILTASVRYLKLLKSTANKKAELEQKLIQNEVQIEEQARRLKILENALANNGLSLPLTEPPKSFERLPYESVSPVDFAPSAAHSFLFEQSLNQDILSVAPETPPPSADDSIQSFLSELEKLPDKSESRSFFDPDLLMQRCWAF